MMDKKQFTEMLENTFDEKYQEAIIQYHKVFSSPVVDAEDAEGEYYAQKGLRDQVVYETVQEYKKFLIEWMKAKYEKT